MLRESWGHGIMESWNHLHVPYGRGSPRPWVVPKAKGSWNSKFHWHWEHICWGGLCQVKLGDTGLNKSTIYCFGWDVNPNDHRVFKVSQYYIEGGCGDRDVWTRNWIQLLVRRVAFWTCQPVLIYEGSITFETYDWIVLPLIIQWICFTCLSLLKPFTGTQSHWTTVFNYSNFGSTQMVWGS